MKTLGVTFIVTGVLISILGYGMYENVICHCPAQIIGKPLNCLCVEHQENTGHVVSYFGLGIAGMGIILFIHGWRKKIVFH
jgi:hypothetical protein